MEDGTLEMAMGSLKFTTSYHHVIQKKGFQNTCTIQHVWAHIYLFKKTGSILPHAYLDISGSLINPSKRTHAEEMIQTGVSITDVMNVHLRITERRILQLCFQLWVSRDDGG